MTVKGTRLQTVMTVKGPATSPHINARPRPADHDHPLRGDPPRTTKWQTRWVQRRIQSRPWWSDSGDLSRAIAYGVLTALDRSPESFHLSSLASSSPVSLATSSPSWSALPVADEGGLPAAVRHILWRQTAEMGRLTKLALGSICTRRPQGRMMVKGTRPQTVMTVKGMMNTTMKDLVRI